MNCVDFRFSKPYFFFQANLQFFGALLENKFGSIYPGAFQPILLPKVASLHAILSSVRYVYK